MGPLLFETRRHGWNNNGLACDFARNLAKQGIATWSDVTALPGGPGAAAGRGDVLLSEPFEVNVAIVLNAYICLARLTACRPEMATNDADDLAAALSHCALDRFGDMAF